MDEVLAGILRRLLAQPQVVVELRGNRLVVHGEIELRATEVRALPSSIADANVAGDVERLRAKITSLRRTAQHLRGDGGSHGWDGDAARLEAKANQHQDELAQLLGGHL